MENTDNSEWDAIVAKLISGSVLFIVSVISGVIPFKLATVFKWTEPLDANGEKKTNKTVNILLCFGGGVLLATTFLHLLPEINHTIAWLVEEGLLPKMSFNLGELLMMAGFFLIYLIEELVHGYLHRHQNRKNKEELNSDDGLSDTIMRGISARNSAHKLDFSKDKDFALPENEVNRTHSSHGHSHIMPLPSNEEDFLVSSLRGLLIVLALSIHELFEGFAVGLEKHASGETLSHLQLKEKFKIILQSLGVYFMFAAVAAHKFVIAFCIGVELMVQRTKLWLAFVYVVIYSIVSAVGEFAKKNHSRHIVKVFEQKV